MFRRRQGERKHKAESYLRDTLAVLATVENGPGNAAGVLALEEEGLRLAVLESENLAVATDVELTLYVRCWSASNLLLKPSPIPSSSPHPSIQAIHVVIIIQRSDSPVYRSRGSGGSRESYLARVDSLAREGVVVRAHLDAELRVSRDLVGIYADDVDLALGNCGCGCFSTRYRR